MSEQTPLDRLLDTLAWEPIEAPDMQDASMPYATHSGVLTIKGFGTMRVYRLNTGERVIDASDFDAIFGRMEEEQ